MRIENGLFLNSEKPSLTEKCGVVGVWTKDDSAPLIARRALKSIQHRGQESAGIAIFHKQRGLNRYAGMGLVSYVLTDEVMEKLGYGHSTIAHNRYSTTGSSETLNAQPIFLTYNQHALSLAHNGNLIEFDWLKEQVKTKPKATSDTAFLSALLLEKREDLPSWEETLKKTLPQIKGAYSITMITDDGTLFAIRDPYGIRPLVLGRMKNGWIVASESVAIDMTDGDFVREIKNGEILKIDREGLLESFFFGEPKQPRFCIFENIYFARPDSLINDQRVREGREESGKLLAKRLQEKGIYPEVIIPVPASGSPAAKGTAQELSLPVEEAITTSHYVGRTFITPGQENRKDTVNGKHNFTPDKIQRKRVVFVDDSLVRSHTAKRITKGLKEAEVNEVYAAFASPPVVNRCDLGVDMKTKEELRASQWEQEPLSVIEKNIARDIGAHSATYLSIEKTAEAMKGKPEDFCHYCFGGKHPIRENTEIFPQKERKIEGKPRISVFISGGGTNLQKIIDGVEQKEIEGEIIDILSNDSDAYGIKRAESHHLETTVLPSKGKLRNPETRKEYNQKLIDYMRQINPDIIVLAGWMVVLSDEFLKKAQAMEIPIINLHPALLSEDAANEVMTSRGKIPVIRGTHAIEEAYQKDVKDMPVSGVTVHQVLPGKPFDVGPIILKEEVKRKKDETLEDWEKRIHETEYRVLPTALKRAIHVLKHNIDISKGIFPW